MRRISPHHRVPRDIFKHDTARGYNRARSDLDAGADKSSCSDPTPRPNSDGGHSQLEIFPSKIVAACAKIGALADADIGFNRNGRKTQNAYIFPDLDVIADAQSPGEGNVHIRSHHHALSDFCAKESKQSDPQS